MIAREAAVAGMFYPDNKEVLEEFVEFSLQNKSALGHQPKILVSPHAGYVYSGECAAKTIGQLSALREDIKYKILLLGPSHRVYIKGAALSGADYFKTPLGNVEVDKAESSRLAAKFDFLHIEDSAHRFEHSLEVQLPFLQKTLKHFSIIPVVYGELEYGELEELLESFLDGEDKICLISSDLSHYYDERRANELDGYCINAVEKLNMDALAKCEACGIVGIAAALLYSVKHNLKSKTLDYRTSANAGGGRDRVVGYGGFIFYEDGK